MESLFEELEALPRALRRQALERRCGDDPATRAELESLLDSAEGLGDFLTAPAATLPEETVAEPSLAPGAQLGPWRVTGVLGRGGMGEVYAAERCDGAFARQVALKVLKRGLDTHGIVARFVRERKILGRLRHPHIAELIDAGVAADGRPFLVMEKVEGRSITEYCEATHAPVDEILRLMGAVCEAVREAHRQLVIHRDLKPSNVLVTAEGEVKLLDFGVAKLLIEADEDQTRTVAVAPFTPAYAAPEQFAGEDASTATDVYALGVLLYRLLTGCLPNDEGSPLGRVVARLSEHTATRASISALRESSTLPVEERERRARVLRGDLDLIVLKALQHDPTRRYRSADELGEDLRRYLDHEPVRAQADSMAYRAGKYLRRHRLGVAAVSAVMLALAAGLIAALWQARIARERGSELEQVVQFQSGLLQRVEPEQLGAGWLTRMRERIAARLAQDPALDAAQKQRQLENFDALRQLSQPSEVARQTLGEYVLAPAAREIDRRFAAQPGVRMTLMTDVARAYSDLGLYAQARAQAAALVAVADAASGPDSPQALAARLLLAQAMALAGDSASALPLAQAVLAKREKTRGANSPDTLSARQMVATILVEHDEPARARTLVESLLPEQRRRLGANHADTLASAELLGKIEQSLGHYEAARTNFENVLDRQRRQFGANDARTLQTALLLCGLLDQMGRFDEARQVCEDVVAGSRRVFGDDHPRALHALNNLANVIDDSGDHAQAVGLYEQVYRRAVATLGEESRIAQIGAENYAMSLKRVGRLDEALPIAERSLHVTERAYGAGSQSALHAQGNLANLLRNLGRVADADALYRRTLDAQTQLLGAEHPETLTTAAAIAQLMQSQGHHAEAVIALRKLVEQYGRVMGQDRLRVTWAQAALADSLTRTGRGEEAVALLRSVVAEREKMFGRDSVLTLAFVGSLANSLQALGHNAEACALAADAVTRLSKNLGETAAETLTARRVQARCADAPDLRR